MKRTYLLVGTPFEGWSSTISALIQDGHKVIVIGWRAEEVDWLDMNVQFLCIEDQWNLNRGFITLSELSHQDFDRRSIDMLLSMYDRLDCKT